jgi:ATP-dependent Clp protease ATP-binding subunit ClpC
MFISRPVSKDLRRILQLATETAVQYRYEEPRTPFVLNALHKDGISDASKIFRDYVTVAGLRYALLQRWGMTAEGPTVNYRRLLDPANFDPILLAAEAYADQAGSKVLGPVHLALALLDDHRIKETINTAGLKHADDYQRMRGAMEKLLVQEPDSRSYVSKYPQNGHNNKHGGRPQHETRPDSSPQAKNNTSAPPALGDANKGPVQNASQPPAVKLKLRSPRAKDPNSTLVKFSVDLTDLAQKEKLEPVIGREKEINRTIEILGRKTKNNPIFIGHEGVGKTAIAEGVAQRIVSGNVPDRLRDKRVFQLQMGEIVAGTTYRGDFETRLKEIVQEASKYGDILFIDEVHTIIGAGQVSGGTLDASNFLNPALARGKLSVMAATTHDEFKTAFRKDKALRRRFQPVIVEPPSVVEAIVILRGLRASYEQFHGVKVSDAAIEAAVSLSHRYVNERYLPDKAIDLVDEACSAIATRRAQKNNSEAEGTGETPPSEAETVLGVDEIAQVVSSWTGVPVSSLKEGDRDKLLNLEDRLKQHVIGQDHALEVVADAIRCARAGLTDPKRPIGTFMFLGRTGIGKTEVARALQRVLFDNDNLLRFDMSEYMEKASVARLIGAPPGYVGYEDGGTLTEAVRRKPYSVILFDEIEKAHPDVFNIFLQLLDDGRLTDGLGNTVDFRNCLIVMSTNCGVAQMKRRDIGFTTSGSGGNDNSNKNNQGRDGIPSRIMEEVERTFRPEFLNRLDEIVLFRTLSKSDLRLIVDIQLSQLRDLLAERRIALTLSEEAKDFLAREGWDEDFGARPLKRVINKLLRKPLSKGIIAQTVADGSTIEVTLADGRLKFPEPQAPEAQPKPPAEAQKEKVPA